MPFYYKPFDSVPHQHLLLESKGYGIEGGLQEWFRNFLTNRQQYVLVCSTYSSQSPVRNTSGNNFRATLLFLTYFFVCFFFVFYLILFYIFICICIVKSCLFFLCILMLCHPTYPHLLKCMLITKMYRELSNLETNTCTLQFDINPLNGEVTLWINSGVYIWKMENNILLYNGTGTKVCQKCKRSWRRDLSDLSYTLTM